MAVTVSLVLLFAAVLIGLLRFKAVGCGAAFVAAGFGFFLAATGAAEPINEFAQAVIAAIPDL